VAFTLSQAGYYGGSPENVYNAKTDVVIKLYEYCTGMDEYQTTEWILNEKKD
jgi:hypothetical protein